MTLIDNPRPCHRPRHRHPPLPDPHPHIAASLRGLSQSPDERCSPGALPRGRLCELPAQAGQSLPGPNPLQLPFLAAPPHPVHQHLVSSWSTALLWHNLLQWCLMTDLASLA